MIHNLTQLCSNLDADGAYSGMVVVQVGDVDVGGGHLQQIIPELVDNHVTEVFKLPKSTFSWSHSTLSRGDKHRGGKAVEYDPIHLLSGGKRLDSGIHIDDNVSLGIGKGVNARSTCW